MVNIVSGLAASTASFSARSSTRAARIGPSGASPSNRRRSALLNGRCHTKVLPATFQARFPYELDSAAPGMARASLDTSSQVATTAA
jgi:hypothetical protein